MTMDSDAILEIMTFLDKVHDIERRVWGDPLSAQLMRGIARGELEGRPFDCLSLALTLDLPPQTVSRRVAKLVDTGLVNRRKDGRSFRLTISKRAQDAEWAAMGAIKEQIQRLDRSGSAISAKAVPPAPTSSAIDLNQSVSSGFGVNR